MADRVSDAFGDFARTNESWFSRHLLWVRIHFVAIRNSPTLMTSWHAPVAVVSARDCLTVPSLYPKRRLSVLFVRKLVQGRSYSIGNRKPDFGNLAATGRGLLGSALAAICLTDWAAVSLWGMALGRGTAFAWRGGDGKSCFGKGDV